MLTENLEHFYLQNVDESDPKHVFLGHLHFVHCVRYILILFRFTHDNQNSIEALKAYTRNSSHPLLRLPPPNRWKSSWNFMRRLKTFPEDRFRKIQENFFFFFTNTQQNLIYQIQEIDCVEYIDSDSQTLRCMGMCLCVCFCKCERVKW